MLLHQFERLQAVLDVLGPAADRLPGRAPEFVRDQVERVKQYGVGVRMSPKQTEWLESLYSKETGTTMKIMTDAAADRADVLGEDERDDMDDEIPF